MSGQTETLGPIHIESVAYGGRGVGRLDGKVYFVPNTVPGDIVQVRVTADATRYADADVAEWLTRSPLRGVSRCAFSKDCGGCQWTEIPYEQQLQWKLNFVASALQRIGKLGPEVKIDITPSPDAWNYRNRIHVKVEIDTSGKFAVGYYRAGSHKLVTVDACAIADVQVSAALKALNAMTVPELALQPIKLEIQHMPGAGLTITAFPPRGMAKELHDKLIECLATIPNTVWAGSMLTTDQAPLFAFDEAANIALHTRPGIFQQINRPANSSLRDHVRDLVNRVKPKRMLDLCCGTGNFALPLCRDVAYVEAIESSTRAIQIAKQDAEKAGIANVQLLAGDATAHLWKCAKKREAFDLVLLDPPREGLYEGIIPLRKIQPQHIIYVSCDPTTLARDVGSLCRQDYTIKEVRCFDFFPNTYHVETVVLLGRREK